MDIASLGFKIDTSDVAKAETALDSLAASGAKTETSARGVGEAWANVGRKVGAAAGPAAATASAFKQGSEAIKAQQAELAKLLGQIDPVVAALGRLDDQEQELRRHKAAGLVDADTFRDYSSKIDRARNSLSGIDNTIRKTGVSSAQTANALRQLPAQFTDIFTSLAGGQNPLLVLIQQGGQIKDSFGGIGETFQALGAQVRGLFSTTASGAAGIGAFGEALADVAQQQAAVAQGTEQTSEGLVDIADSANSVVDAAGNASGAIAGVGTVSLGMVAAVAAGVAAVAALALAYKQGSDESSAFNKAIALTGNFAGTTSGQLADMARQMDDVNGTQRQASAALAEVTATGRFTALQIQDIAAAAVAMEEATGKAISGTVDEFKRLGDEPAAASAKLNEQYNYLTASVYEQISALESQGDAAGAAQLAIDAFGEAMNRRAVEIEGKLGLIEGAWKAIKNTASEAWDEMLGVGRENTLQDQLNDLNSDGFDFGKLGANAAVLGPLGAAKELYAQMSLQVRGITDEGAQQLEQERARLELQIEEEAGIARQQGILAQANKTAIEAQREVDALEKQSLTNAEKRNKALEQYRRSLEDIRKINPGSAALDPARIAKTEANINERFKDPKAPKSPKAPAVRDDEATRLLLTLQGQEKSLQEQLASELKLTAEQKKRAEFEQLIADLKTKDILTADQKSLLANQDAIKTQLDKNVALAEEVRLHTDSIKLQERSAQIQASIETSADGRRQQQQRNLDAFGQGRAQQEQAEAAANIFREFRRYQDQLNKNTPKDLLGSEQYQTEREKIGQGLRDALSEHEAYYQRLEELQGSWQVGASQAFADFAEQSQDIAGQTANIIGSTLEAVSSGISESLTDALLHGEDLRESMADLGDEIFSSVVESLIQMGAQYAINSALEIAGLTAVSAAKVGAKSIETTAELTSITATTSAEVGKAGAVATAKIGAITATKTAASIATAATTTEQVAAAGTTASSWSFAAIAASIGSFGTAAAIGLAAVVAAMAMGGGFRKGGYTGNGGVGDVAGVVHGQEFVFDAAATSRIGVGNLEAMRAGRDVAIGSTQQAAANEGGSSRAPTIIHNNNSFPGITDSREAKRSTAQASRQMARAMQSVGRYS